MSKHPALDPPRLEANCTAHGAPLAMCDHCADTRLMSVWTGSLSGGELADALAQVAWNARWYAPSEVQAILAEAAFRLGGA